MNGHFSRILKFLMLGSMILLLACQSSPKNDQKKAELRPRVHYLEIVSQDVDKTCQTLEKVLDISFGAEVVDLGMARVAEMPGGTLLGVRAPLAGHEQPIVRTYIQVEDIHKALETAEKAGAEIAYPPTRQGETGVWAIYIQDGIQYGLWQQ
ncbi:MAG: hypothetical protein Kow0037_14850 [Calditrichia bacterium]